jgi:hypothetical protein
MEANSDIRELLRRFNGGGVRYLVAGGYAVMKYTEPCFTKDLDLWVDPAGDDAQRVLDALQGLGAPLESFRGELPQSELGVAGLDFETAWENRVQVDFAG